MTLVAIQPAGNAAGRQHYVDTVENPVRLDYFQKHLGKDFDRVSREIVEPQAALWGVTQGKKDVNISKYNKLQVGDLVIFTKMGRVFGGGEISSLFHSKSMAKAIWGVDPDGYTWEYMYALKNVRSLDISYEELRQALGSASGDNFMGFRVLNEVKSTAAFTLVQEAKKRSVRLIPSPTQTKSYSNKSLGRAGLAWSLLVEAAEAKEPMVYGEITSRLGLIPHVSGSILGPIQQYCVENDLPPLTTLAVNKHSGVPGTGNYIPTSEIIKSQKAVFSFDWTLIPNPFLEFIPLAEINPPTEERALRRVDNPPHIGERFKNRTAIWKAFGGQKQQGLAIFPNETILNIFSDEDGPYPDFIDPETGVIEYRGQGLLGNQKLTHGNKKLEDARLAKEPVRFWFKASKGLWNFSTWVVVSDRSTVLENDTDDNSAHRLLWFLVPVTSPISTEWSEEVKSGPILDIPIDVNVGSRSRENLLKNYAELSKILHQEAAEIATNKKPSRTFKRRKDARDLVLARANEGCEYDKCTGMPPDISKSGRAILQVDHIMSFADGGPDTPSNMIAICPNCHAAKTIGKNNLRIARAFKEIVSRKEKILLGIKN